MNTIIPTLSWIEMPEEIQEKLKSEIKYLFLKEEGDEAGPLYVEFKDGSYRNYSSEARGKSAKWYSIENAENFAMELNTTLEI